MLYLCTEKNQFYVENIFDFYVLFHLLYFLFFFLSFFKFFLSRLDLDILIKLNKECVKKGNSY